MQTQAAVSVGAYALLDDSLSLPPSRLSPTHLNPSGRSGTGSEYPVFCTLCSKHQ